MLGIYKCLGLQYEEQKSTVISKILQNHLLCRLFNAFIFLYSSYDAKDPEHYFLYFHTSIYNVLIYLYI